MCVCVCVWRNSRKKLPLSIDIIPTFAKKCDYTIPPSCLWSSIFDATKIADKYVRIVSLSLCLLVLVDNECRFAAVVVVVDIQLGTAARDGR